MFSVMRVYRTRFLTISGSESGCLGLQIPMISVTLFIFVDGFGTYFNDFCELQACDLMIFVGCPEEARIVAGDGKRCASWTSLQ